MSRHNFETITPAPGPRKPIRDGISVGTIRTRYSQLPPTYMIACEHCGHTESRTEWQAHNRFHCYECHKDSFGPVMLGKELPTPNE